MARYEDLDEVIKQHFRGTCGFCAKNPTDAVWEGANRIEACADCAVNVLPLIIADAISIPKGAHVPDVGKQAETAMGKTFWRGIATRLSWDAKK